MKIMQKEMPSSIDFNKTMASRTQSVGNSSQLFYCVSFYFRYLSASETVKTEKVLE